ncbi:hypothetical protein GCM10008088_14010 [Mesonia mobilis]|uniref:Pentapeptide repeat-containing protein n=1 Tax=Mesonia mobilis TaxID=369791 RepID=A0ABQ3BPS7_9FLAO|nr:hypothetical protein GCM10008088_14010 [Mesonia mobilis]
MILLGHSHPECAFNDSLINGFKNFASSGESYFYTYPKVKELIRNNQSIETVFIEFTNNQLHKNMDNWIFGKKYINHRYPKYSAFLNNEQELTLLRNNPLEYINSISQAKKKQLFRILTQDYNLINEIGGYRYLEKFKIDSILKSHDSDIKPLESCEISEINLFYLREIINFCHQNKKQVYLVRSPQHKKYYGGVNETQFDSIRLKKFSDVEFLDFNRFPLNNKDFADLEHLNFKGARKFSIFFNSLLQGGLLEKSIDDKQKFIDLRF